MVRETPLDFFNGKKTTSLDLRANTLMVSIPKSKSQLKLTDNLVVDPAFRLMRFPLDGELDFDFEK